MNAGSSMPDAAATGRFISDIFSAWIKYADPVHAWEPLGGTLIDYSQENPLLNASREVLEVEFPRRKFDTHRQITVGGLKAFSGSYWTGAERYLGLAQLNELVSKHRLGFVEGGHLMSRKLGRMDESPGSGHAMSVSVRVEFTRPSEPAGAWVVQQVRGDGWEPYMPRVVDATWQVFCELLDKAPVATAYGYWNGGDRVAVADGEIHVGNVVFLPPDVVRSFGGPDEARGELGAVDCHAVSGDADTIGLALRLWKRHGEATPERVNEIGQLLRRHGMPAIRQH